MEGAARGEMARQWEPLRQWNRFRPDQSIQVSEGSLILCRSGFMLSIPIQPEFNPNRKLQPPHEGSIVRGYNAGDHTGIAVSAMHAAVRLAESGFVSACRNTLDRFDHVGIRGGQFVKLFLMMDRRFPIEGVTADGDDPAQFVALCRRCRVQPCH
jgi:hypothetical protein